MKGGAPSQASKGNQSQNALITQRQWYLKSPNKTHSCDRAFKVVPTLNHAVRVNNMNEIIKEN